jgi:hypothetical protein
LEERIARAMSVIVVERLEAIEIDEEHRKRGRGRGCPGDRETESLAKVPSVRQGGQFVMKGQVARSLFSLQGPSQLLLNVGNDHLQGDQLSRSPLGTLV